MWMWSLLELVHVQFFASLVSLNKFRISTTSWVSESDRAVWSREKLQPTSLMSLQNWVLSDVSLYVTASVVIFNVSAISWTAFLFASFNSLLHPTKEEVHVFARVSLSVCLSVCLLARLLQNACMDLDEMLRVDRCRDMDELINFWARSIVRMPEPDCFLQYRIGYGTLHPCPGCQRAALLRGIVRRQTPTYAARHYSEPWF